MGKPYEKKSNFSEIVSAPNMTFTEVMFEIPGENGWKGSFPSIEWETMINVGMQWQDLARYRRAVNTWMRFRTDTIKRLLDLEPHHITDLKELEQMIAYLYRVMGD